MTDGVLWATRRSQRIRFGFVFFDGSFLRPPTLFDSYELRSSAFYDIFNDSYDLMEEKTGRSLCRLAMANPVPLALDSFTAFFYITSIMAAGHVPSCMVLIVLYWSDHVVGVKKW